MGTGRRIAIYNKWWATAGGGEKYTGGLAEALSRSDDVTLLVHQPLAADHLSERLSIDLGGLRTELIEDRPAAVSEASEDYDVFINASFTSDAENRADAGLYVTYFPTVTAPRGPWERARRQLVDRLDLWPEPAVRLLSGFHLNEQMRGIETRWTMGEARLRAEVPRRGDAALELTFGRYLAPELGSVPVSISDDESGEPLLDFFLHPRSSRFDRSWTETVSIPLDWGPPARTVRISSPAWNPSERFGTSDDRVVGVPLVDARVRTSRLDGFRRSLAAPRPPFLDSYDTVVAISAFTQRWIRRLWSVESEVLFPPVSQMQRGVKKPIILSVGRFFGQDGGHSKKQLEMVSAFAKLLRSGVEGWEYHLVGGCERAHRGYLREVRNAAAGMPVHLHVNATGGKLTELYEQASIFWHATGLGEDPDAHPERLEHFGITTAEAMSAGIVPVVIGMAGQLETVEHGVSGLQFADLDELVSLTRELIHDEARRELMADEAQRRAKGFGIEAFGAQGVALVDAVFPRRQ